MNGTTMHVFLLLKPDVVFLTFVPFKAQMRYLFFVTPLVDVFAVKVKDAGLNIQFWLCGKVC